MSEAVAEILTAIDRLSPAERAELEAAVLLSMSPTPEPSEDTLDEMLASRADDIRLGRVEGVPAEEVFARLRARR